MDQNSPELIKLFAEYVSLKRQEVTAMNRSQKSGFDSALAPKFVNIERCGQNNEWCLSVNGQAKPYRTVTGHLVGISVESGQSDDYGSYQLVFMGLQTDDGLLKIRVGMMPRASVPCKNILSALKSASAEQLKGFITFQFDPNPGT